MNAIDFDRLESLCPKIQKELAWLREWFMAHPHRNQVIAAEMFGPISNDLIPGLCVALQMMVNLNMLSLSWKLRSPSGELLPGIFAELENVPSHLTSNDGTTLIPTSDCSIVAVYSWEPLGHAGTSSSPLPGSGQLPG